MTPERYQALKGVFVAVRDLPDEERAVSLERACGDDASMQTELERLLAAHDRGEDMLDAPVPVGAGGTGAAGRADSSWPAGGEGPQHPNRIGRYRIQRVLGEGGMGVVYEAEQENPRRRVALKVIRPGVTSRQMFRRFEHEAQLLGRLQHPAIAQILEAGTADTGHGRQPFFAMEFVRGSPITEHADAAGLGARDRMELLSKVCDGVEHAHQKGVIHRDLKPGNILVDQAGQPKILDFGVARATDSDLRTTTLQTDIGQLMGTIPYMSPEQVTGDPQLLDTRSDVYSLGVIYYELLTGHLPHDLTSRPIPEAVRTIREDEVAPLRSVNKLYRGDLDTIAAKALEKDKERRYQSASEFSGDLRRFLRDEPIAARPASALYQMHKFARRHRGLVGGMAAAALALILGTVVSTGLALHAMRAQRDAEYEQARAEAQTAEAEKARRETEQANDESKMVIQYLDDMLASASPENAGRDVRVKDVLDDAARTIGMDLAGRPLIEARLRSTIGTTYTSLGEYEAAEVQLASASEIRQRELGPDHSLALGSLIDLAGLYYRQGRYDEAFSLARQTLAACRRVLGAEDAVTLAAQQNLGVFHQGRAEFDQAESLHRSTLEARERLLGDEHPDTLSSMHALANLQFVRGRFAEAEQLCRQVVELRSRVHGEEHPRTLASMTDLASLCTAQARYDEAEQIHRAVLDARRRVLGDEHPDTLESLNDLARLHYARGRHAESEKLIQETLEVSRRVLGDEHRLTLTIMNNLAILHDAGGRFEQAEGLLTEVIDLRERVLGVDHTDTLESVGNLAALYTRLARPAEAEPLLERAVEGYRRGLGGDHPQTLRVLNRLAGLYMDQGHPEQAELLYLKVLAGRRRTLGTDHPDTLVSMNDLAVHYYRQDRLEEAEELLAEALEGQTRASGPEHPKTIIAMSNLAAICRRRDRYAEAEKHAARALAISRRNSGDSDDTTLRFMSNLAKIHIGQGRYDEAETLFEEAVSAGRTALPPGHPLVGQWLVGYGQCLTRLERFDEAETASLEGHTILRERLGARHALTIQAQRQLVELYQAWGKPEQAETWRDRIPTSQPAN